MSNKLRILKPLSLIADADFYTLLERGEIYLQHYNNPNMPDFFKDIKWFWNKDTHFLRRGEQETRAAANKTYRNVRDWVMFCGGRNSGLWIPSNL